MSKEISRAKVIAVLADLSDSDLFSIYNEYADENNYETIYPMEEFNDICSSMDPDEIANKIFYGDFNPNHNYFVFNGCDNFESFNYVSDYISLEDLADYAIRNNEPFCIDELEEMFEGDEEDE